MPILQCYIDQSAMQRLEKIAKERDVEVEALAESSIEEAALDYFRHRKDDPGREAT